MSSPSPLIHRGQASTSWQKTTRSPNSAKWTIFRTTWRSSPSTSISKSFKTKAFSRQLRLQKDWPTSNFKGDHSSVSNATTLLCKEIKRISYLTTKDWMNENASTMESSMIFLQSERIPTLLSIIIFLTLLHSLHGHILTISRRWSPVSLTKMNLLRVSSKLVKSMSLVLLELVNQDWFKKLQNIFSTGIFSKKVSISLIWQNRTALAKSTTSSRISKFHLQPKLQTMPKKLLWSRQLPNNLQGLFNNQMEPQKVNKKERCYW